MTELQSIFLTSALTVFSGTTVFVIGQVFTEFMIKPYIRYKEVVGKIDEELIFYSNIYTNAGVLGKNNPIYKEASKRFRRLASKFASTYRSVGCRLPFRKVGRLVSEGGKNTVIDNLISISNSLWGVEYIKDNLRKSDEIRKLLKIWRSSSNVNKGYSKSWKRDLLSKELVKADKSQK